jgi:ADP-L-glycero-D-manno-heptose 6-epimerase
MDILVTGSEGFIGRNLVKRLTGEGYFVHVFDIKGSPRFSIAGMVVEELERIKSGKYDLVIHLGANSSTTETDLNKILYENFTMSQLFFEACKESDTRFQYASSASVYGLAGTFEEDQFCKPLSPYAFSKYMFDCWIGMQHYPYQGFRYFNVYGGDSEKDKGDQASPIFKFAKQARETGVIKLFEGSENLYRDFVCVEDVCEMHLKFINAPEASGVFNIGTGQFWSFEFVAKEIQKKIKADIEYIPFLDNLIGQYQSWTCADLTKLEEAIGEYKWTTVEEWIEKNIK